MIYRTAVLAIGSVLLWQNGSASSSIAQKFRGTRRLGDRVDELDKSDAICAAGLPEELGAPTGVTRITFFYAVESEGKVNDMMMQELDQMLYYAIGDAVLWCSQPNGDNRRLAIKEESHKVSEFSEGHRHLSAEEARRLGIISFNSAPSDFILESETCAHKTESDDCVIVEGKMALMAHQTDSLQIIIASILDAIQSAMDDDVLIPEKACTAQICSVEKVRWLGTTIAEARAGGPPTDDDDAPIPINGLDEDGDEDEDDTIPVVAYAAIPLAFIMAMAYTLAKKKRRILTAAQLGLDQDYVRVGTGDPPRHFHEGMYHYTRAGASYLSTNCPTCEETRRLGFCTDADLPTLAEGRLYHPTNGSQDESEVSDDPSTHRKLNLINPNEHNLAGKHSSIDVHQCTSATCRICNYQPKDVAFVVSPRAALSPISCAV